MLRGALLWSCLIGCNQLYGLDATNLGPEPRDADGDGVIDEQDICPGVADENQLDRDDDGFGDECDFCPDLATRFNHDEDSDTHGDECDLCPADPNFQIDAEGDDIGDACDNDFATQNQRLLFDPFLEIDAHWDVTGVWSALGDAVTSEAGAQLDAPGVRISGTGAHEIIVGISMPAPLVQGASFGIELVADDGSIVVGCVVDCASSCILREPGSGTQGSVPVAPTARLILRRSIFRQFCLFGSEGTSETVDEPPPFTSARVRLRGSPQVQLRYISVVQ